MFPFKLKRKIESMKQACIYCSNCEEKIHFKKGGNKMVGFMGKYQKKTGNN